MSVGLYTCSVMHSVAVGSCVEVAVIPADTYVSLFHSGMPGCAVRACVEAAWYCEVMDYDACIWRVTCGLLWSHVAHYRRF